MHDDWYRSIVSIKIWHVLKKEKKITDISCQLANYRFQLAFMKYQILRLIALFIILINLSSCFEGRWGHYKNRHHYIHKKHYARMHQHRNGDW